MTSHGRKSTKLGGDFALSVTSIIMMLLMILLMIEDRCGISFAKKMHTIYIILYHLLYYVVKKSAKQIGSVTLIL